jgi:hypothetical protein
LVYKADRASRIERVGIENLLILFAARAAGRLIAGHSGELIADPLALPPGGPAGPGGPASPLAGGSLCPHAAKRKAAKITKSGRRMNHL